MDRNILDLVTGVVSVIGVGVVILSHVVDGADWASLQMLVALSAVACLVFVCYELMCDRYKGSLRFAVVEVAGGTIVSFAMGVLLAVDIAIESGLFFVLSIFGYLLVIGGVVGNWRRPLSGGEFGKRRFDPRCKF